MDPRTLFSHSRSWCSTLETYSPWSYSMWCIFCYFETRCVPYIQEFYSEVKTINLDPILQRTIDTIKVIFINSFNFYKFIIEILNSIMRTKCEILFPWIKEATQLSNWKYVIFSVGSDSTRDTSISNMRSVDKFRYHAPLRMTKHLTIFFEKKSVAIETEIQKLNVWPVPIKILSK